MFDIFSNAANDRIINIYNVFPVSIPSLFESHQTLKTKMRHHFAKMFKIIFTIFLLVDAGIAGPSNELGCRDENNNLVDWFYAYKLPEDTTVDDLQSERFGKPYKSHNNGLRYLYMISSQNDLVWIESNKTMEDPQSLTGHTVSQLYDNADILSVMYNDEPPKGSTDMVNGHTKGVVGTDNKQGFWLIHSVPHFPPNIEDGAYGYPPTGHRYGQSFLCITMSSAMIELVGNQLRYNEPTIYSSKHQSDLESSFPNMMRVINGEKIETPPFWNFQTIKSLAGVDFHSFAKGGRFNKELYEDWVAPTLKSDLLAETWINGPGKIPSDCSKSQRYKFKNI